MTAHILQNGGIRKHQQTVHQRKIKTAEILELTKALYRIQDKIELQIMEALLIKQHNPPLNNQQSGDTVPAFYIYFDCDIAAHLSIFFT